MFVATVLGYLKPSAEDRRSEIKLIGTWEVRLTEARSATTATRLVQHSEHEIRGQVSRPGPVSGPFTTVKKKLEIHFAITMLNACGRGVSFFAFDGLGGLVASATAALVLVGERDVADQIFIRRRTVIAGGALFSRHDPDAHTHRQDRL